MPLAGSHPSYLVSSLRSRLAPTSLKHGNKCKIGRPSFSGDVHTRRLSNRTSCIWHLTFKWRFSANHPQLSSTLLARWGTRGVCQFVRHGWHASFICDSMKILKRLNRDGKHLSTFLSWPVIACHRYSGSQSVNDTTLPSHKFQTIMSYPPEIKLFISRGS